MISSEQKPACPVCRKTDKVLKLQMAYNQGVARLAPPPMPTRTVGMMRYLALGMLLVGLCIFFVIVLIGSESFGNGFSVGELILVILTLACIIGALSLSFIAFTRIVGGDRETEKLYPEWDRAMEQYQHLRYCVRDDTVFDPQTGKTLSGEALASLLAVQAPQGKRTGEASLAH
ncbi:MAG TPA: hypothetical protein VNE61_12785 [Ktedonobacteraceae bacterium]|nr:hypothetical protein [Ktedonobacteraceae bacterium]